MVYLLKGAIVEYGTDLLGPLKNVVIFQFNPESLSRTISSKTPSNGQAESGQSGSPPTEQISFTAYFSADDGLGRGDKIAQTVGIGPQLYAIEKMMLPEGKLSDILSSVTDSIGSAIGISNESEQNIPRENIPKVLFIWGATRILPVKIESISITEEKYDNLLNPIQAKVDISLSIYSREEISEDLTALGALEWTSIAKNAQAITNLTNTAGEIKDLIPFS